MCKFTLVHRSSGSGDSAAAGDSLSDETMASKPSLGKVSLSLSKGHSGSQIVKSSHTNACLSVR